ncbi:MAG: Gfo/Idh/MocA family oxidoreductase [Desulfobacterales bacterium]
MAEKFNTRAFTHCADLFGHVDAVSIAVPTPCTMKSGNLFLENGIDVLIEKPITTTVEEAITRLTLPGAKSLCFRWGSWNAIRRWPRCSTLWIIRFLSSPTGWAFTRNVART